MTTFDESLAVIKSSLAEEAGNGAWKPQPGDALHECEFIKVGFRSWGLEAPDKSWRLVLSRLDFGDSNPSALLTVYAPDHDNAFGDLGWLVFSHTVGINGGTNYNQCVARLNETLGGSKIDWGRRIVYLIGRAKQANAGTSNGTFSTSGVPSAPTNRSPFVFVGRIREGRTLSVFGPGGAGKTTFVDGLVVSACSGREIVPNWRPSRRYRVLVLDWDEGREEEEVRLSAICRAYGVRLEGGYHYKRMSRPLVDLADDVGAYVVQNGIELVIVSPVDKATEDRGDNLAIPVIGLYEVLRTFDTTNILIDHVPGEFLKTGAQREIGSTKKRDNARGSYSLYQQVGNRPGWRSIVLRNTKADALLPEIQPQAISITYEPPNPPDGLYDTIRFEPDEIIGESGISTGPREPQWQTLVRLLREHGPKDTVALCAISGFAAHRLRDIVRDAREKGNTITYENGSYELVEDE